MTPALSVNEARAWLYKARFPAPKQHDLNTIRASNECKRIAALERRSLKIEEKLAKTAHLRGADGYADADALLREVWRDVFSKSPEFTLRSFLRRREKEWKKNPPHDAHVRLFLSTFSNTDRLTWTCSSCEFSIPNRNRPRGGDGRLLKHCGCRTGKGGRMASRVSDAHRVIAKRISRQIWQAIRGKKAGRKWEQMLGYTAAELLAHLGRMLPKGVSMQRCIDEQWHVDHIIPKSAFDLSNPEELRAAWCLSNLRLIPGAENVRKSDKHIFLL